MRVGRWLIGGAVGGIGAAGALFTLSLTGDVPGLLGLAAIAALPLCGLALAVGANGRESRGP